MVELHEETTVTVEMMILIIRTRILRKMNQPAEQSISSYYSEGHRKKKVRRIKKRKTSKVRSNNMNSS
jgi:hypothetical protein